MKNNLTLLGLVMVAAVLAVFVFGLDLSKPKEIVPEVKLVTGPVLPLNNRLNDATVMVSNREKTSGGSGVIFQSTELGSYVLTNAHVCGVLDGTGGIISTNKGDHVVEKYVKSKTHDICIIFILKNLGVDTLLANNVSYGDKVHVSGHPFLLPNTITDGYLSNSLEITLLIDVSECTDKELENNGLMCFAFGGMPIVKNYTAQAVSAMSAPGNSGSGVYNDNGEIVGLLFAGIGRSVSHGLIVPLEYVKMFISSEIRSLTWVNSNSAKRGSELQKSKESSLESLILSNSQLENIAFPAIKSDKFEKAFDNLESWKKTQKQLDK